MFALSTAQQVVWLHEQVRPGGSAYHFTALLDLSGPLDEAALATALTAVIDRHAMFRTALVAGTDPPRQRTAASVPTPLRTIDLPDFAGPAWVAVLDEHVNSPFDLSVPPLVRWTLARVGPERHRLLHTEHHFVHDGQSWTIVLRDLFTAYRAALDGRPVELPAAAEYAEYVAGQTTAAVTAARDAALAAWRDGLARASLGRTVPGTRRRSGRKRFAGAQVRRTLDADLSGRVRATARARRHTPFSVLYAIFAELCRRYTGETDLVLGTAVGIRPPAYAGTVGMFVNAVPVRLRCEPDRPAHAHVAETMAALLKAVAGAAAPIQDITREVGASGADLDNPLFRLMFSAYDAGIPDLDLDGLRVDVTGGVNLTGSRLDIDVVVVPDDRMTIGAPRAAAGGMLLIFDYDTDRYDPDAIELFAARYARLLDAYVTDPDRPLADLSFADPAEPPPQAIGAGAPAPAVHGDLFARYAAVVVERGDAPALIAGPTTIGHNELLARAERLAGRLTAAGVTGDDRVAVVLPRGADAVVGLLACLRLGAAFCPLAPTDPPARRRALLDRLSPAAVVTDAAGLAEHGAWPVVIATDAALPNGSAVAAVGRLGGTAYVMHTSGSTGRPKPVAVGRDALSAFVSAIQREYGLGAGDRVLQFAQPWFDVFLEETLPTLLAGAAVVVAMSELPSGADLAALIALRGVTVVNLPTAYTAAVLPELETALVDWPRPPLRLVVIGGERVAVALARRVREVLGEIDIVNAYGVTEATVTASSYRWSGNDDNDGGDDLPIGRPLAGTCLYVVDPDLRPLPAGMVGEIAIGGSGVASGYLDDSGETARRFVPIGETRCYLTGDLGYWRSDGQLCFVGRRDNQVKLQGYRIELEEVEAVAAAVLGGARRAVVVDESGPAPRLVGFVETDAPLADESITRALAERLPRTMLPARWVAVPRLPVLAGGKPDRAALAALIPAGQEPADLPESTVYERVRAVWGEVLGRDGLDAGSDFFALGGHSLLAIQIVARLRPSFGEGIPLALVFDEPVLGRFAAAVGRIATAEGE